MKPATAADLAEDRFVNFDWVNGLATELVDLLDAMADRVPIRLNETELVAHRRAGAVETITLLIEARAEALNRKDA